MIVAFLQEAAANAATLTSSVAHSAAAVAGAAKSVTETSNHKTETLLFTILIQLVIMIVSARVLNLVFRRFGQPGVMGEVVAGLLLGPSLLGHFFPEFSATVFGAKPAPAIVILSQVGLIFLMFQIGMNFEFSELRQARSQKGLIPIALASVAVPFGLGLLLGHFTWPIFAAHINQTAYALFCGVSLAITAVPVLGRILAEFGLNRQEIGVMAISAAAINDVAGWLLLAGVSAFAAASFTPMGMALQVGGVIVFGLVCLFALRPAARWLLKKFPVKDGQIDPSLMAILLIFVFIMGMCTFKLGIFAIFGGFAAGLLFHDDHDFVEAWRRQVGTFVLVFFLPIFFTFTGLRTNVLGLTTGNDLMWLLIILACAALGKIVPVFLAARASGYDSREAIMMGAMMNTRGLMELIVLNVGFEMGVLPQKIFTMLVIMAVVTSLMTGPILKALMARMGLAIPRGVEA